MTTPEPHAHGRVAKLLLDGGSSNLADGEWHRLHPLTPLFKGGLVFIVVLGIVFANLRDRLIYFGVRLFAPHEMSSEIEIDSDDPVSRGLDWVMANNLVFLVLLGLVVLVAIVIVCYWLVWRFQQFRITGENVEVKKGIIFRSQRRAPLDRVQGVNLTRPFPARLIGMAKLTLEGAGTGADVALEYLATNRAEQVRADILRLASGVRQAKAEANAPAAHAPEERASVAGTFNQGVTNIIDGVDTDDVRARVRRSHSDRTTHRIPGDHRAPLAPVLLRPDHRLRDRADRDLRGRPREVDRARDHAPSRPASRWSSRSSRSCGARSRRDSGSRSRRPPTGCAYRADCSPP